MKLYIYIYIYIFAVVLKWYTEMSRYQTGTKTFQTETGIETVFITFILCIFIRNNV